MQIKKPMITSRQFIILAFIGGIVIKGLMLPSVMLRVSGRDGLFVMAIYFVLEIINIGLFCKLISDYPDKTFFTMLEDCFGKAGGKIILMLLLTAALVKFTLNLSEVKAFFAIGMFASMNWAVMIIPVLILCFAISVKSLRVLGRAAEIFFPFIAVSIVLLMLILFREVPLENVLPLLEEGASPIKEGIIKLPMWFGDVIVLAVALGNVKNTKRLVLKGVVARTISSLLIMAFSVALFSSYGNIIPLVKYGHNITTLTQYNLGSQEFGRFDLIIYSVWMSGVFIKMAMNCYLAVRCAARIINVVNYKYISAVLAAAAYILSIFAVPAITDVYELSTALWARIIFSAVEFLLPVVLFAAAKIKYSGSGGKKHTDGEKAAGESADIKGEKTARERQ